MSQHVLEAFVIAGEVEQHPVTHCLGYAARALTEISRDIVLSEIRSRREEHDRLLLAELVIEDDREARVGAFGHSRGIERRASFLRVVVNEEMLGLLDFPIQLGV